jgi:hypothetical protein
LAVLYKTRNKLLFLIFKNLKWMQMKIERKEK